MSKKYKTLENFSILYDTATDEFVVDRRDVIEKIQNEKALEKYKGLHFTKDVVIFESDLFNNNDLIEELLEQQKVYRYD